MMVRLIPDLDACIGSAECVALDPDAIELDGEGLAHPIIGEMDQERAQRLCDVCPVGALSIVPVG
jgi:ferredoxin